MICAKTGHAKRQHWRTADGSTNHEFQIAGRSDPNTTSGGAKVGCALLMVPGRPLPNVSLVSPWPLRHGPNAAVAINAADLARGHETFLSSRAADRKSATD